MKTVLAVSLALTASAVTSAQCLEVDEVFSLNSNVDAQTWACELYDNQQRLVGETYLVFNVVPYSAISAAHNQMVTTTDQFEDGACRLVEAVPVTQRNERLYNSASGTLIIGKYRADATQYFDINYRIQGRAKVVTDEENNELKKLQKAGELDSYPGYRKECTPLMCCRFGVSNPTAGQHWLNKLGQ